MSVTNQPTNFNFLSPLGYKFVLRRAPNVEYFVQRITLPDLTLPSADTPSPFVRLKNPGEHLDFGSLSITFKINENMDNYLEIYRWMIALGFPESFDQYVLPDRPVLLSETEATKSDIGVTILTSAMNPNIEITMRDCFPTSLTQVELESTTNSVEYIEATATFAVRDFTITKL